MLDLFLEILILRSKPLFKDHHPYLTCVPFFFCREVGGSVLREFSKNITFFYC